MWRILIFFLLSGHVVYAQTAPVKRDSAKVYRDIEEFSKKRKSTNFLYQFFFKPVKVETTLLVKKVNKKSKRKSYSYFEGKIIRHISIVSLDPFGYNLEDTTYTTQNILYKAGNSLHIKTLPITISNLLLIKKNEPFDSLLVKESERLVRSQKYVHEVFFYPMLVKTNSDSVDIFIHVLDEWSIIPDMGISETHLEIDLTENNFLGTGHRLQNNFIWNHTNGRNVNKTIYYIPNIHNTYINSGLQYSKDENGGTIKSLVIDRPFFSTFAKWAAGISLIEQFHIDSILLPDSSHMLQNIRVLSEDYWAGKSWRIFKGNSEDDRTTNLILSGRYLRNHYIEKPEERYDTLHAFAGENFYLASIGISTRKYVQDKYVFNYGVIEDVPIGRVYSLTGGYQVKINSIRWYLGFRYAKGNYYDWGYISTSLDYGTFIHSSHFEQGTLALGAHYFTHLFEIGKWKFRQFLKPQLIVGLKRLTGDAVSINEDAGIKGFNSVGLSGKHKLLFTFQTQSYAPWTFLGFKFGPYILYSIAMLGTDNSGFRYSRLYSRLGLGVLIKNEFLVFGTFQVSFAFYPLIPGIGEDVFKYNPDKTSDFGFRDFSIPRPTPVVYQ